ncbi:hypothetical protein B0H13DRAFT_1859645 [Mycena leptocephala]|nr:hypothetical protein B0H13DRAFT_1859645 [Mycena leptocephala]
MPWAQPETAARQQDDVIVLFIIAEADGRYTLHLSWMQKHTCVHVTNGLCPPAYGIMKEVLTLGSYFLPSLMPKVPSPSRARKRLQRNRRACDVTTRKYDAISLLRVTSVKSVDSLKQLVFDLGRRVRSIEDTVSRLPTSQSHLSDHSAGFGYGGSRDFEQYYQKYPISWSSVTRDVRWQILVKVWVLESTGSSTGSRPAASTAGGRTLNETKVDDITGTALHGRVQPPLVLYPHARTRCPPSTAKIVAQAARHTSSSNSPSAGSVLATITLV